MREDVSMRSCHNKSVSYIRGHTGKMHMHPCRHDSKAVVESCKYCGTLTVGLQGYMCILLVRPPQIRFTLSFHMKVTNICRSVICDMGRMLPSSPTELIYVCM